MQRYLTTKLLFLCLRRTNATVLLVHGGHLPGNIPSYFKHPCVWISMPPGEILSYFQFLSFYVKLWQHVGLNDKIDCFKREFVILGEHFLNITPELFETWISSGPFWRYNDNIEETFHWCHWIHVTTWIYCLCIWRATQCLWVCSKEKLLRFQLHSELSRTKVWQMSGKTLIKKSASHHRNTRPMWLKCRKTTDEDASASTMS